MTRVLFLSSEPFKREVAGIGLRYLQFARTANDYGFETTLAAPTAVDDVQELLPPGVAFWSFRVEDLPQQLARQDVVVVQGQLGNNVVLAEPEIPLIIDLFDPWLVENAVYLPSLGFSAFTNDLTSWRLQMSRGDRFLCSSDEQRLYYAGFLTALGRIHPQRLTEDPELKNLLLQVPFGVPDSIPPYQPLLPERSVGERRILFGALYDWYDPWTVLEAVLELPEPWTVWFVATAHPESTPQQNLQALQRELRRDSNLRAVVRIIPWTPAARRFDLLRDVDLLVAPARPGLEDQLAWRTRFLEALAVGCPVLLARGGSFARTLEVAGATRTFEPGNAGSLRQAIADLDDPSRRQMQITRGHALAQNYRWRSVFEPLAQFLASPHRDPWTERISVASNRVTVREPFGSALRRKLRHKLGLGS